MKNRVARWLSCGTPEDTKKSLETQSPILMLCVLLKKKYDLNHKQRAGSMIVNILFRFQKDKMPDPIKCLREISVYRVNLTTIFKTKVEYSIKFETVDRSLTKPCCSTDIKYFRSSYIPCRPAV
jgi:hypothetical protein